MLFIHPMWQNEIERLGKKRCTPVGYLLHVIAEYIGFAGLLVFLATLGFWGWRLLEGTFHSALLWWSVVPIGLGILSESTIRYSWRLANRCEFQFDQHRREACWMKNGEFHSLRYKSPDSPGKSLSEAARPAE